MNLRPSLRQSSSRLLERIAWFCTGSDIRLMEASPRSDQIKYQGLGWSIVTGIFITMLMSAGLTVSILNQNPVSWGIAICIALLTGVVALRFYRWSLKFIGWGDRTSKITLSELRRALPLFICSLTLGSILSVPAEMKVMQSEIQVLTHKDSVQLQQQIAKTVHGEYKQKEDQLRADIAKIERDLTTLRQRHEQLRSELLHIKQSKTNTSDNERIDQLETQFQIFKASYQYKRVAKESQIQEYKTKLRTLRQQERRDIELRTTESKPYSFWYTLSLLGQTDGVIRFFVRSIIVLLISCPILFGMMLSESFFSIYHQQPSLKRDTLKGDFL